MDMVRGCLLEKRPFGVCLVRESTKIGSVVPPELIGTLATIGECDMQQLGVLHIMTRGSSRFRIVDSSMHPEHYIQAKVELIEDDASVPVPAEFIASAAILEIMVERIEKKFVAEPYDYDNATWVANRLCELLPIPMRAKQKLLELTDGKIRLSLVHQYLAKQGLIKNGGSDEE